MPVALTLQSEAELKFIRAVIPSTEIYVLLRHSVAEYLNLLPFYAVLLDVVPDVSKDHSVLIFRVKKSVAARNGVLFTFYCSRRFERSQCLDL